MRLYGEFTKVEPQDDGTIIVHGIASSGAVDEAGEVIQPGAMKAAIPDYMKFGAVREMHGLSAAGTALKVTTDDEGFTNLEALIVDPLAVKKVQMGVYKGLSIGGKVLGRDPANKTIITALKLNEISLVDRPCNPEAAIGLWKADGAETEGTAMTDQTGPTNEAVLAKAEELAKAAGKPGKRNDFVVKARALLTAAPQVVADLVEKAEPTEAPAEVEKAAAVDPEPAAADPATALADALAKAKAAKDGGVKYADPKNSKYPIDTAKHIRAAWAYINMPKNQKGYDADELKAVKDKIVAAWKDKIDADGPPSAQKMDAVFDLAKTAGALRVIAARGDDVAKGLYTVGNLAAFIDSFVWMQQSLAWEAKEEGDNSPLPAEAADVVAAMLTLLAHMVAEESAEIVAAYADAGMDIDFDPSEVIADPDSFAYASTLVDLAKADDVLMAKVGARHSKGDMAKIQASHDHMASLGAKCDAKNCDKAADPGDLEKAQAENARLAKALADAAPAVDDLAKTISDQGAELAKANTAIAGLTERLAKFETMAAPAKTAASQLRAVTKGDDADPGETSKSSVASAAKAWEQYLSTLSEEDRALEITKAALRLPITGR